MQELNEHFQILASKILGKTHKATVLYVYDGDTFVVDIPYWPDIVGKHMPIRVNGIDAPEIHDKRPEIADLAQKAKAKLTELLENKKIALHNMRRDKYFRILADVYVDGMEVSKIMLDEKLVKEYHGESKTW